jgi:alkylation response protein AidB-like acyl-CoA dehydrogenase
MSLLDDFTLTGIPAEDEALREPVRAFLRQAMRDLPAHRRARSWMGGDAAFSRQLAERGWVGATLPKEYGGAGRSSWARFVLAEELLNAGAPVGLHWIAERQSGPLLLKYGSESQKAFYLPRICRAEAFFCIGMSEPGAGSDLAAVRTRASLNADGSWTLNGQKIWTTNAHHCHCMLALVRTCDRGDDRHAGLSQFIVDLKLPGVTIRPIVDLSGDRHFCEVFFDNVRLDPDALVGRQGEGWNQVMSELAFERSGPERLYSSIVLFDEWLAFLRTPEGRSDASVRLAGRLFAQLLPIRALLQAVTARIVRGETPAVEAALVKDMGTGFEQEIVAAIADDLASREGPVPLELLRTLDYLTGVSASFTLRGGARDILRGMIARGLGLR